jgi:2-C-methyl-D-erythritol 4-phosphate cytidylyltransferase / 2-C-methyl-D-erythritol 2,4-cyclodiphosphate synthase
MSIFLILLAAGDSKRLKSNTPKPYCKVNNRTILEHSLSRFKDFKEITKTIVVYKKKHKKYLDNLKINNVIKIIGGKSRQESTMLALKRISKMNCKKVLIHDSARPNTSKKIINNLISKVKKNIAVVPTTKVTDAVKRIQNKTLFKNIKRDTLRFSQTPQAFDFKKIYHKHIKNKNILIDDDASLFINDNESVTNISGSKKNFKITDNEDLEIFKLLKNGKNYSGIGFDVHRLTLKRKLYLGGVSIKSNLGTLGHSDGDPVLHAIIDGILGACKLGDIGEKFSDKNKKFKNIRSTVLLKKIIKEINTKGYFVKNMDINIITETPKIKKYKQKMINSISKLCKISSNQINIKGKTTEKLGIIGNEKAIASEVIVNVVKYD